MRCNISFTDTATPKVNIEQNSVDTGQKDEDTESHAHGMLVVVMMCLRIIHHRHFGPKFLGLIKEMYNAIIVRELAEAADDSRHSNHH